MGEGIKNPAFAEARAYAEELMSKIDNKKRQVSWEQVAKQYESERDALEKEVWELREKIAELEWMRRELEK